MGLALVRALSTHTSLELIACGIRAGTAQLAGTHFEQAGLAFAKELIVETPAALFKADCVIDFTTPENTVGLAALAASQKKILVSGTTGLNSAQKEALIRAGEHTQVVWSSNMSIGVNVLMDLVEKTAARLGSEYDIEITEMHHKHKVDSPSGTALSLGEAAAKGRKVDLHDVAVKSRDGIVGARKEGTIGFTALRGGDVIGDHSVMFAGAGETLTLSHHAANRDIFALGALRAAQWAAGKHAGFYTMRDVIA
jgi:4-hydroxy-tetrahydrodipicolinate reductase